MTINRFFAPVAALALALGFAAPAVAADATPAAAATPPPPANCRLTELASLPITFRPDGSFTVAVEIGGSERNILVDLSAPFSGAFEDLADQLKLQKYEIGHREYVVYHKRMLVAKVVLPDFHIGHISVDKLNALFIPKSPDWSVTRAPLPEGVDGFLGRNFLGHFDLEFDFAHKRVNLFKPGHCGERSVYWADSAATVPFKTKKDAAVMMDVKLDGRPLDTEFDTVDGDSRISVDGLSKHFSLDTDSKGVKQVASPAEGQPSIYRYPFRTLSFGGATFANPIVDIRGKDARTNRHMKLPPPGNITIYAAGDDFQLGVSELKNLRLFLSWNDHAIYFTAADATKPADPDSPAAPPSQPSGGN